MLVTLNIYFYQDSKGCHILNVIINTRKKNHGSVNFRQREGMTKLAKFLLANIRYYASVHGLLILFFVLSAAL